MIVLVLVKWGVQVWLVVVLVENSVMLMLVVFVVLIFLMMMVVFLNLIVVLVECDEENSCSLWIGNDFFVRILCIMVFIWLVVLMMVMESFDLEMWVMMFFGVVWYCV